MSLCRACTLGALIPAAVVCALSTHALAQDCACDHTLPLDVTSVNGADMNIQPGDTVCVEAGERPFLTLDGLEGTEAAPVTVINCGGQVVIDNADRGYGLRIGASKHFHVTGTGDPAHLYGFVVSASRTGPDYAGMGVPVGDLSTDYEMDHIEVHHTGFAGFTLKTESRCDGSANLGAFVQRNTRVHHTYVHDTGGEAFYVGSTGYGGRDFTCEGQQVTLYPHEHDGVWLHDNIIENTGWDGLQVGVTPTNCEVYRNRIVGVGRTATDSVQTRGIQIGGASACRIYDNYLEDGPTIGIFILGAGNSLVYNNVVVGFGEDGIYANDQKNDAIGGASYVFLHNTVVESGDTGISIFGALTAGNAGYNNLIVGATNSPFSVGGDVDWQEDGNLVDLGLQSVGFVDPAQSDFHLTATSPARDVGVSLQNYDVPNDRDGVPRDSNPDVGAYEFIDGPRPSGGAGGAAGSPSTGGAAGVGGGGSGSGGAPNTTLNEANDDSGCACRTSTNHERDSSVGRGFLVAGVVEWMCR